MADMTTKAKNKGPEQIEGSTQGDLSSSGTVSSGTSTTTKANGGTRSSPPRVGGTGQGEATSVKARNASRAKRSASRNDANK